MKKFRIAGVIFLILAVILGGAAVYKYQEEKNAGKEYEKIREEAVQEDEPPPDGEEPEETARDPEPAVEIPIDFRSLQAQNPDVYAWIRVPGTEVDYPILQSPDDNSYYLDHDINRTEAAAGAIFT